MGLRRLDILRDRLGIWVWNTSAQPIEVTIERARRYGYKWIAVKAQDGNLLYRLGSQQLGTWRKKCEEAGIHFGVWGFLYGDSPVAEANLAAHIVNESGAQFYIADAEDGFEKYAESSERFSNVFRLMHPHLPKALSSFGRIDYHRLDWHAWARNGFTFMPQAYVDVSPLLRPSTCISVAERAGLWTPSEIAVTFEANSHVTYREYVREAAHQGVRGFNIWRADLATDQMLKEVSDNR